MDTFISIYKLTSFGLVNARPSMVKTKLGTHSRTNMSTHSKKGKGVEGERRREKGEGRGINKRRRRGKRSNRFVSSVQENFSM